MRHITVVHTHTHTHTHRYTVGAMVLVISCQSPVGPIKRRDSYVSLGRKREGEGGEGAGRGRERKREEGETFIVEGDGGRRA